MDPSSRDFDRRCGQMDGEKKSHWMKPKDAVALLEGYDQGVTDVDTMVGNIAGMFLV
jgi:hypothetical protein